MDTNRKAVPTRLRRESRLMRYMNGYMGLIHKVSTVLALNVAGAGLAFFLNILLARLLGAAGAGTYYLALTTISVLCILSRVGLDNALMRYVAAYAARNRWRQVVGVYRLGMWTAGLGSCAAALLAYLLAPPLAEHVFSEPSLVPLLRLMSLSIPPAALLTLHAQALKAIKRPAAAAVLQSAGLTLVTLILVVPLGAAFDLVGVGVSYLAAQVILLLVGVSLWRHATPHLRRVRGVFSLSRLLATSAPLLLVAAMNLTMNWTDTFMLGALASATDVGVYGVVMRTALLTGFVLTAVNSVVAPQFAELYAKRDLQTLGQFAQRTTLVMTCATLPILAVMVFLPTQILGVFGTDFTVGANALIVLAVGQFIHVAAGSVAYLLVMTGAEKLVQTTMIVTASLNVLLNFLLIPRWGVLGAATATATSLAVMNMILAFLVYKRLKILTFPLPLRRMLTIS